MTEQYYKFPGLRRTGPWSTLLSPTVWQQHQVDEKIGSEMTFLSLLSKNQISVVGEIQNVVGMSSGHFVENYFVENHFIENHFIDRQRSSIVKN